MQIQEAEKIRFDGIDIEETGQKFTALVRSADQAKRLRFVHGIEVTFEFPQHDMGTVVQFYDLRGSLRVVDANLFVKGNETDLVEKLFVLFRVFVALGGSLMVVEGDAGRDNI